MEVFAVVVALALAFLVFRFVAGMVKFAILAVLGLGLLWALGVVG